MLAPFLGIDHVHVYVPDAIEAARWYCQTLGFHIAGTPQGAGPLMLEDRAGSVRLALFERHTYAPLSALAFSVDGRGLLEWKVYLEALGLLTRSTDHRYSYSLYFDDPFGHSHEITSRDVATVRAGLA